MINWLKRKWLCRWRDEHDWQDVGNNYAKRRCSRCQREDWLMGTPYPTLDRPALIWRTMYRGTA